jgi:hypothetical protein
LWIYTKLKFSMDLDGILFKDGSVCVNRPGGENIQSLSLSLLPKGENNKTWMLMHIEMGRNLAY